MPPRPKAPAPAPPKQTWKRTGKCVATHCDCERYEHKTRIDSFNHCQCGHTQDIHMKVAHPVKGMVDS